MTFVDIDDVIVWLSRLSSEEAKEYNRKKGKYSEKEIDMLSNIFANLADCLKEKFIIDDADVLKPCPHCGGSANILNVNNDCIVAKCSVCGASTKALNKRDINSIVKLWNKRIKKKGDVYT